MVSTKLTNLEPPTTNKTHKPISNINHPTTNLEPETQTKTHKNPTHPQKTKFSITNPNQNQTTTKPTPTAPSQRGRYINGYSGNVKTEITGVLYHESTHIWQWNGNGQSTPGGLIEGIADYVRLKAGYAPSHWVKPGQGDRWDQGYDVTALFLDYCNGLRNGFVAELNKKLRNGYSANFFVELLGKNVDQLWKDYKAKYAK